MNMYPAPVPQSSLEEAQLRFRCPECLAMPGMWCMGSRIGDEFIPNLHKARWRVLRGLMPPVEEVIPDN